MIVSTLQKLKCYEIADSGVLGRNLISQKGRQRIVDKTISAFERQMQYDSNQFTKGDRNAIVEEIKNDQEIVSFVIFPTILLAIVGWIVQKVLDSLWDWWSQRGN